jgi:dTDP-glucose pyrophosphorylase
MLEELDWRRAVLGIDASIKDVIVNLDQTAFKITLIEDLFGHIVGTVTDGDIRRNLLKGGNLETPVSEFMNCNFISVDPGQTLSEAKEKMIKHKIMQIPIVNNEKELVGLRLWHEVDQIQSIKNPIVIMAGGRGKRLSPETDNCPKPMLLISGRPILEHIILKAKKEGFTNFIISIFHLGEMIEEYFGSGEKLGVNISYLRETRPLGTAGALSLLNPLPDMPIIITNGDVLSDVKFNGILEFHKQNQASATMGVQSHEWQVPYGVIDTEGIEITGYNEKPSYKSLINAGVYVLNPEFRKVMETQEMYDMPTVFTTLSQMKKKIVAYPIYESWIDIGMPDELHKARNKY